MLQAMSFEDWWLCYGEAIFTRSHAVGDTEKDNARTAWLAAKESEMLANHPDISRKRIEEYEKLRAAQDSGAISAQQAASQP